MVNAKAKEVKMALYKSVELVKVEVWLQKCRCLDQACTLNQVDLVTIVVVRAKSSMKKTNVRAAMAKKLLKKRK